MVLLVFMKKNYLHSIVILALCFFTLTISAQEGKQQPKSQDAIEGLNLYPNPVSSGKIYISSKSSANKDISIFDVLGKKVLQATLNSKELNISSISPGVYIIKIKEGEATATRKLIIK